MMNYIIAPSDNDIIHGGGGSHKYIDRVMGKNGKWRYIYKRAAQKTKYAIKNEVAAQRNLKMEKDKADAKNFMASMENEYVQRKVAAENKRNIQAAKDRTALGRLKKHGANEVKKKLNKGLDWLEHNKIFSDYTESTLKINGKLVDKKLKKNRFKVYGENRSGR